MLGLAASTAAAVTPADLVLEPSAGTGLLAIFAELANGALVINELADVRAGLLDLLFPGIPVSRFDAAQIDDHLGAGVRPSVVLMNPAFSAMAHVERRMADTTLRHVSSALARLADGGRLVAITGANFAPDRGVNRALESGQPAAETQEFGPKVRVIAARHGVCQSRASLRASLLKAGGWSSVRYREHNSTT
jgi:hypothetical protein